MANRSASTSLSTALAPSQCQGSTVTGKRTPARLTGTSPNENSSSSAKVTAARRTLASRQKAIAATTATMSSGQPR